MSARLLGIENLPINGIDASKRLRPLSEAALQSLTASIRETGHMADEIHVRKVRDEYLLIAGGHRLEVGRREGWETIRAKVWECSAQWAKLWELDDNLAHAELSTLELATFLAERKAVFLKMHPEKRKDVSGGLARHGLATDIVSVAKTIAEKRGISERHVYRLMAAGERLTHDQLRWLRDAPKQPTLADLTALSKVADERVRTKAILDVTRGDAASLKASLKTHSDTPSKTSKSDTEQAHERLLAAFDRAPKAARARFVRDRADELRALLSEVDQ